MLHFRYLPSEYFDGKSVPRGGFESSFNHCSTGNKANDTANDCASNPRALLPNPRKVSYHMHSDTNRQDEIISNMFVQFAQFVDHDITLSAEIEITDCCQFPDQDGCFPIFIPCDDPHFLDYNSQNIYRSMNLTQNNFEYETMKSSKKAFQLPDLVKNKRNNSKSSSLLFDKGQIILPVNEPVTESNNTNMTQAKMRSLQGGSYQTTEAIKAIPTTYSPSILPQESKHRHEKRPTRDPKYCLEFPRSIAFCEDRLDTRQQMNGLTSFLDLSQIYGNDLVTSKALRTFQDGLMKMSDNDLLPDIDGRRMSGDARVLEMPGLAGMHTIWIREHNRIAKGIKAFGKNWTDEEIYQVLIKLIKTLVSPTKIDGIVLN